MRVVIVYESMFGNTRVIADAIARGMDVPGGVRVVSVSDADHRIAEGADVLVVGGPTHAHSMSRPATRKSAADMAAKPNSKVKLELYALGKGVREWLDSIGPVRGRVAVFDTRMRGPRWLTGSAAVAIARALRRHGADLITKPASFFVTKNNALRAGEEDRATAWGHELAETLMEGARSRAAR